LKVKLIDISLVYCTKKCWQTLDSTSPTWENIISGQVNMRDAVRESIEFTNPNGKKYALRKDGQLATLLVR
jgi:malate synthase